jgi:type II secretory pathway pseudopilin PulG
VRHLVRAAGTARRQHRSEGGFTLVELLGAIGVIFITLLLLVYTATVTFSDVAMARQRQGATGLANQTMEQVRALPFDKLKAGLSITDLTANPDADITGGCGSAYCYGGEQIPVHSGLGTVRPFEPAHVQTGVSVGTTSYTIAVYPTYYQNDATVNAFRVTVVVTWAKPARQGVAAKVQTESVVYSPTGCQSTATHPLAAPCQPFLYATASQEAPQLSITGAGAGSAIQGIALDHATLTLPSVSSTMQIEQVASVQGRAQTSGIALQLQGQAEQASGRQVVTSGSDNDATQPKPPYDTQSAPAQAANALSATDASGRNAITVAVGAGDLGATTSTVAADGTNACKDVSGNSQVDMPAQPCGNTTATQVGALSAVLRLQAGATDLGNATLASVLTGSNKGTTATDRALQAELAPVATCLATPAGSDGCVRAAAARAIGTVQLGGLPASSAVTKPASWNGYLVSVAPYADTVTAEGGVGAATPPVPSVSGGTITWFDGSGYQTQAMTGSSVTVNPVAHVALASFLGGQLTIDMTGTLSTGARSTSDAAAAGCASPCSRTATSAKVTAPLSGDIRYTVTWNGLVLADLDLHVDLGNLTAKSTYAAAPSGS